MFFDADWGLGAPVRGSGTGFDGGDSAGGPRKRAGAKPNKKKRMRERQRADGTKGGAAEDAAAEARTGKLAAANRARELQLTGPAKAVRSEGVGRPRSERAERATDGTQRRPSRLPGDAVALMKPAPLPQSQGKRSKHRHELERSPKKGAAVGGKAYGGGRGGMADAGCRAQGECPAAVSNVRQGPEAEQDYPAATAATPAPALTVQSKLVKKLHGARFRQINEQLYMTDSRNALQLMCADPSLFWAYHEGFREQAARWPVNPLHGVIDWVRAMPETRVVGDFGCGDAQLAASVPHRVHSFDLVAANARVTACDMSCVPLADRSLDVAVFCLALMGTNWPDFVREAARTLRCGGLVRVVEVRSRVTDLADFVCTLEALGFDRKSVDEANSNSHFVQVDLKRAGRTPATIVSPRTLAPCMYKKR